MFKSKIEKAYDRGFRGIYFKKRIPRWIWQTRKYQDAYDKGLHEGIKKDVANEDISSFGYGAWGGDVVWEANQKVLESQIVHYSDMPIGGNGD